MSGGHFPKWDAIQISLSFVRVRHGCVFGNENQTVTEGFLLFVYSLSWPVYTGSFKKKKKKRTETQCIWVNQRSHPQFRHQQSIDWDRGWGWRKVANRWLPNRGLAGWAMFKLKLLFCYSHDVPVCLTKHHWRSSITERVQDKASRKLPPALQREDIYQGLLTRRHFNGKYSFCKGRLCL